MFPVFVKNLQVTQKNHYMGKGTSCLRGFSALESFCAEGLGICTMHLYIRYYTNTLPLFWGCIWHQTPPGISTLGTLLPHISVWKLSKLSTWRGSNVGRNGWNIRSCCCNFYKQVPSPWMVYSVFMMMLIPNSLPYRWMVLLSLLEEDAMNIACWTNPWTTPATTNKTVATRSIQLPMRKSPASLLMQQLFFVETLVVAPILGYSRLVTGEIRFP